MVLSSGIFLLTLAIYSLVRRLRRRPRETTLPPPPPPRWLAWVGIFAMLVSIADLVGTMGGWEFEAMPPRAQIAFRILGVLDALVEMTLGWLLRASVVSPSWKVTRAQGLLGAAGIAIAVATFVAALTLL